VSQQALVLGFATACQLELSMRLRWRLECDPSLKSALALCLVDAAAVALEEL
jgi:hypothetical protein